MSTPAEATRTRREEYAEATRQALLDSAQALFARQGYAATSLDEVAREARVTKGAVYHHFTDKAALFEAVADRLERHSVERLVNAAAGASTAWEGMEAGIDAFLDYLLDPMYGKVCFVEGPAALGFERWWTSGRDHEGSVIRAVLEALQAEGHDVGDDLDTLADLLFGAMTAVALSVVRAEDPAAEVPRMRAAVLGFMRGVVGPPAPDSS